jgi:hypothetical protein
MPLIRVELLYEAMVYVPPFPPGETAGKTPAEIRTLFNRMAERAADRARYDIVHNEEACIDCTNTLTKVPSEFAGSMPWGMPKDLGDLTCEQILAKEAKGS